MCMNHEPPLVYSSLSRKGNRIYFQRVFSYYSTEPEVGIQLGHPSLRFLSPCVPDMIWQMGLGEPDEDSCYLQTTSSRRLTTRRSSWKKIPNKNTAQLSCVTNVTTPGVRSGSLQGQLSNSVLISPWNAHRTHAQSNSYSKQRQNTLVGYHWLAILQ